MQGPTPDRSGVFAVPPDAGPARMLRRLAQGSADPTMEIQVILPRGDAGRALGPGSVVHRAIRTSAGPATVVYRQEHPAAPEVTVESWGPGADEAVRHAPDALGVDDRPEDFNPEHPGLRRLMHRTAPLRVGRSHSLTEVLIPTILGQKVQVVAAQRSYRALCQRYGGPAPGPFPLLLPPDPERLAHAGYEHFHPMNVERRRADVVRRVAARQTRIDRLVFEHPPAEVRRQLCHLRGIGPWTSASATLLVCGDPDAMILGDFHLPNFVAWTLAGEPRGDDARMQVLLEPFTGHRARVQLLAMRTGSAPPRRGARLSIRDIRDQ